MEHCFAPCREHELMHCVGRRRFEGKWQLEIFDYPGLMRVREARPVHQPVVEALPSSDGALLGTFIVVAFERPRQIGRGPKQQ